MNRKLRVLVDLLERSAVAIDVRRLNKILLGILAAMLLTLIVVALWQ
jgi:hypothetical protein